jgi:ribosomal protein S18 acetylase RimI-like enzyme
MSKTSWNIRPANPCDLQEVMVLYKKCTVKMNQSGLFNWHDSYPDLETISNDIDTRTLYILEKDGIQGAVALNSDQPPEYRDIKWEYHKEPYLVVHRLAISPDQQGKGYGINLMEFAEELAAYTACPSIRMDVYTINTPGRSLYQKLEYTELNEFFFPGFETPFVGLEKKVFSG